MAMKRIEILEDCWIIKVDDKNYYGGWMNDEYIISEDYEDVWEFETRNSAYAVLEQIKYIYPKAKVFHLITGIDED